MKKYAWSNEKSVCYEFMVFSETPPVSGAIELENMDPINFCRYYPNQYRVLKTADEYNSQLQVDPENGYFINLREEQFYDELVEYFPDEGSVRINFEIDGGPYYLELCCANNIYYGKSVLIYNLHSDPEFLELSKLKDEYIDIISEKLKKKDYQIFYE